MEDKKIDMSTFFISVKRIELLLEELIFRQILSDKNGDADAANESFKNAMQNVLTTLQSDLEDLPSAE